MASGSRRRSRVRIEVGSRVKICLDKRSNLLFDMGLQNTDGSCLKNVWMHGTVTKKMSNYYALQLPAAEDTLTIPAEQVFALKDEEAPRNLHVVMDGNVKTVCGLQLPANSVPKDYYYDVSEAQNIVQENAVSATQTITAPSAAIANSTTTEVDQV